MSMESTVVTLNVPSGAVLSGKIIGLNARASYKLDELDTAPGKVTVKIPARLVTSSFVLGMFSQSVTKLGLDGFFEKYQFDANPSVLEAIDLNARFSSLEGTALSQ